MCNEDQGSEQERCRDGGVSLEVVYFEAGLNQTVTRGCVENRRLGFELTVLKNVDTHTYTY